MCVHAEVIGLEEVWVPTVFCKNIYYTEYNLLIYILGCKELRYTYPTVQSTCVISSQVRQPKFILEMTHLPH